MDTHNHGYAQHFDMRSSPAQQCSALNISNYPIDAAHRRSSEPMPDICRVSETCCGVAEGGTAGVDDGILPPAEIIESGSSHSCRHARPPRMDGRPLVVGWYRSGRCLPVGRAAGKERTC